MEEMRFISCIRFLIQLLMAETFLVLAWKRKKFFAVRLISSMGVLFFLSWFVFYIFVSIPGNNPLIYTIYYISLFIFTLGMMKVCFQAQGKDILFAGVCGYATQHIGFSVMAIIVEITHIEFGVIGDFIVIRILPYLFIDFLVYFLLIRKYAGKSELKDKDIRMMTLSLVVLLIVIFISVVTDRMFLEESGLLRNVLCKVYAICCSTFSIFLAFNLSKQNWILHENEIMENMLHKLKDQQKLSRENINIINIKCHDLKYRISKIPRIQNAEEQKEYIESIKSAVSIYDNIYQTGNNALDLVLTEKSLMCSEYHIKLSSMIDGTVLNFMKTTDVYALFGNLMDNAIESVLKEEDENKRIISIHISKKNQGYHIHIENYCNQTVVFEDGLPITSKKDKTYHGFGVRSIKYIVEKYKGDMLMMVENQHFLVDILFYPE